MKYEQLKSRIDEVIDKYLHVNEDGGVEIYCDYKDELSNKDIKEIMENDNPEEAFQDFLSEWSCDYSFEFGEDEFENQIKQHLSDEEIECWKENEEIVRNDLWENYYFYYPAEHFNKNVNVNIMIDSGNANYDFTNDHVLDWYGQDNNGNFDENSSILWLAKQQEKDTVLQKEVKKAYNGDLISTEDEFINTVIQELENSCSLCTSLTFLVSMPLFELFKLHKEINKNNKETESETEYITLDKSVICGLYDSWNDSGSVLGIECENDIEIQLKYIFDAWVDGTKIHGYDIGEVYGMCDSAWKDCLKETHYVNR